jgi:hypothetical protein
MMVKRLRRHLHGQYFALEFSTSTGATALRCCLKFNQDLSILIKIFFFVAKRHKCAYNVIVGKCADFWRT